MQSHPKVALHKAGRTELLRNQRVGGKKGEIMATASTKINLTPHNNVGRVGNQSQGGVGEGGIKSGLCLTDSNMSNTL